MEVTRSWTDSAPDPAFVRVCADVTYDDRPGHHETFWVDLPTRCAGDITTTANPWAIAMLPIAATIREPLRLCAPVDPILLANLKQLLRIWRCWYPKLAEVPIVADVDEHSASRRNGRTVAFFSGGVDSFFTLLRDREGEGDPPIDDLLTIWGFDVPLADAAAFQRMRTFLQGAADATGKELITAATNLRETRFASANWGMLAHGCGLASIAFLLERRWSRVLIPSSYTYAHLHPWGSHALTDPLLSATGTVVVHDGAESDRVEKTRLVAQSPAARHSLRVCWVSRSDVNCGACEKCYRTMTTLWLLGALDKFSTFSAGTFDPDRIDRILCRSEGALTFIREIRDLAFSLGRREVVAAIDRAITRSGRLLRAQAALTRLGRIVDSHPVLRPASWLLDRIQWRLFRNAVS